MDVGFVLASLGAHYSWARPDYVLNHMSIDQIIIYQEYVHGMAEKQQEPDFFTDVPMTNGKRVIRR